MSWFDDQMDADAIVVGAGLAGLVATAELARAGRPVLLLDQEPESNLGGQAFWSFGPGLAQGASAIWMIRTMTRIIAIAM